MCRVSESISVPLHGLSYRCHDYIQGIFNLISLIPSTVVMQELHNKEMVMNAFAGFENKSPLAGFTLLLLGFSQHFAFIRCFSAFISWHTACINKQQEANRGRSMDLQCPLLFLSFHFSDSCVFSSVCRITPPCNSVPTNWIKRTSLESRTPSWSSTEATRMAREFISVGFSFQLIKDGQEGVDIKEERSRGREN